MEGLGFFRVRPRNHGQDSPFGRVEKLVDDFVVVYFLDDNGSLVNQENHPVELREGPTGNLAKGLGMEIWVPKGKTQAQLTIRYVPNSHIPALFICSRD